MKLNIQIRRTMSGSWTASFQYDPVVARAMREIGMNWNSTGRIWWTNNQLVADRLKVLVETGSTQATRETVPASQGPTQLPWWSD